MSKTTKAELMTDTDTDYLPASKHPPKNRVMTKLRRRKIIEACLDGKDIKQAAISVGYSPKTAGSQARQILADPNVKASFVRILEEEGLDDRFLAASARDLMNATTPHYFSYEGKVSDERFTPAHETRRKTLELIGKFKGHLKDSATSTDPTIMLMSVVVNQINTPKE